jgi:hypothetical protein
MIDVDAVTSQEKSVCSVSGVEAAKPTLVVQTGATLSSQPLASSTHLVHD